MKIKGIVKEDFTNYHKPSLFIAFPTCTFKCEKDCGERVCQNSTLAAMSTIDIDAQDICKGYLNNPITQALVCGGLEPFDSFTDVLDLVSTLRILYKSDDDIVIYTGYTEEECEAKGWLKELRQYKNIVIKFGRFVPDEDKHFDEVLGVYLASSNQYGKVISL